MNVNGNIKLLLSMHGTLDADKCIQAAEVLANIQDFNIDEINRVSETGGLYVQHNGKILDTFTRNDELFARYKIVPTGLKFRFSEYPLMASFIKLQGQWEGCFLGTTTQLFEMYKKHYSGNFDESYKEIFCNEHRVRDIRGFGLIEVLSNDEHEDTVYSVRSEDYDDEAAAIEVALAKLNKQLSSEKEQSKYKKRNNQKKTKAQKKAERLQQHYAKVKEKQEVQKEIARKQLEYEMEEQQRKEIEARTENGVVWSDVLNIENVHFDFEDEATLQFKDKVNAYVNQEYSIENSTKSVELKLNNLEEEIDTKSSEASVTEEVEVETESDIVAELDHDDYMYKESDRYKMQIKIDVINDIYERLLIKEEWKYNNKCRLGFYLKGVCFFVWREQQKEKYTRLKGNGYIMSNDKKLVVINTGLLDRYGNFIYLIDHTPTIPDFYTKIVSIMYNKVDLLKYNFDIDIVKNMVEPIKYVENSADLIFKAEYEDFDLDDMSHLYHIITERKSRLPDKYADSSEMTLCNKIKDAIRQAVMISKADYKYIVPKYDFSRQKIQFLIPLFLDNQLDKAPELTIVVGKQASGIWSIFTILYSDDAYDDARLLSRPSDTWLNMKKKG